MALDLSPGRAGAVAPAAASPRRAALAGAVRASVREVASAPAGGAGAGVAMGAARCACGGVAGVCAVCCGRPAPRAPRAGTQGFRPPEVLLKYPHQTTAVDVWAAGVVLASALTARYPFFRAGDDVAALAELADLLGTAPLQRTAEALGTYHQHHAGDGGPPGRRVVTSLSRRGLCLRKLAARLRGAPPPRAAACARCRPGPAAHCLCPDDTRKAEEWEAGVEVAGFPDAAFALAARLLEPDPRARISAAQALHHPFLAPPPPPPAPL